MRNQPESEPVTKAQLVGVMLGVVALFGPALLMVIFPENPIVRLLFGEGRIVVFWFFVFGLVFVFRDQIDKYFAGNPSRRKADEVRRVSVICDSLKGMHRIRAYDACRLR